jgi:hypothetical protein
MVKSMRYAIMAACLFLGILTPAGALFAGLGEPLPVKSQTSEAVAFARDFLCQNGCSAKEADTAVAKLTPEQLSLLEETAQLKAGVHPDDAIGIFVLVVAVLCLIFVIWALSVIF